MRLLTSELDLFRCQPDAGYRLLTDRAQDEAYVIYKENSQYAVLFPAGGSVGLDLTGAQGQFLVKWLDISNCKWSSLSSVRGGKVVPLQAPSLALWIAFVHR